MPTRRLSLIDVERQFSGKLRSLSLDIQRLRAVEYARFQANDDPSLKSALYIEYKAPALSEHRALHVRFESHRLSDRSQTPTYCPGTPLAADVAADDCVNDAVDSVKAIVAFRKHRVSWLL